MENERLPQQLRLFLDLFTDLLIEKYFERIEGRLKKIPELRRLITAKEASQYLSISTDTVYRLAAIKRLPYLKIGNRVLFDIKALDKWIEKNIVKEKDWKKDEIKVKLQNERIDKKSIEPDLFGMSKKRGKD